MNDLVIKRQSLDAELRAVKTLRDQADKRRAKVSVKPPSPNNKEYQETQRALAQQQTDLAATVSDIEKEIAQIDANLKATRDEFKTKADALSAEKSKLAGY